MSIIYRYGVSLLSREKHIQAKPQELMIDKQTGQILLKRENGQILSYDSMTRFRTAVETLCMTAEKQMLLGQIQNVVLENRDLPCYVESDEEILTRDEINVFTPDGRHVKKFVIQLDLDVLDTTSKFSNTKGGENVIVTLEYNRLGDLHTVQMPITELNEHVFSFDGREEINIVSVKINNTVDNDECHYILHNILLLTV